MLTPNANTSRTSSACGRVSSGKLHTREQILLTQVPSDYITISSALGEATPFNIIVLPVLFEQEVKAVIELASFNRFSETHQSFLDQLTKSIGIVLNTIAANMRTEGLLKQSQLLTTELQSQQEERRAPMIAWSNRPQPCGNPKNFCANSRTHYVKPTRNLRTKLVFWRFRKEKLRSKTARSRMPSRLLKTRPNSSL